jgi:pimeloyl-ACP methyl ester carboxylesterase
MNIHLSVGKENKALAIFINGLGMDSRFWTDTRHITFFSGIIPAQWVLGDDCKGAQTLWETLKNQGVNLIAWTSRQSLPLILEVVAELDEIVLQGKRLFPKSPIALIGHSRGGLVARKYMELYPKRVHGLITIATPHQGSAIALLGRFLTKLCPRLPSHVQSNSVVKGLCKITRSQTFNELLPGCLFLKELQDRPDPSVRYLSIGGDSVLFCCPGSDCKTTLLLEQMIRRLPLPLEMKPGSGDWLVSIKSARLPWATTSHTIHANHFSVISHRETIDLIVKMLNTLNSAI